MVHHIGTAIAVGGIIAAFFVARFLQSDQSEEGGRAGQAAGDHRCGRGHPDGRKQRQCGPGGVGQAIPL